MKAAKGKGAPIRVPKEALKPVDDGLIALYVNFIQYKYMYVNLIYNYIQCFTIFRNSKRRAILLGVGALALSSCPASSLFAEEIPQNYEAFVNKSDGYSYYYPSDWRKLHVY
ncbi:LOW QUALITY PROTEIN: hypothetical protein CsSME_00009933 [Camellia sinensis var. sinensis]